MWLNYLLVSLLANYMLPRAGQVRVSGNPELRSCNNKPCQFSGSRSADLPAAITPTAERKVPGRRQKARKPLVFLDLQTI